MNKDLLNESGQTEEEFLAKYELDKRNYPAPFVTCDNLVFTIDEGDLKVLMIKRGDHPCIGMWSLPGGFINMDENLDKTAERELLEETNVSGLYLEQLYTFGDINRDKRHRIISTAYMALVNSKYVDLIAGDDANDAEWFKLDWKTVEENKIETDLGFNKEKIIHIKLTSENNTLDGEIKIIKIIQNNRTKKIEKEILISNNIGFDHLKVIHYGLERLQNKIDYTDVIFNLLEDKFTWRELKGVYETIKGESKYKAANFRRKFEDMVIETDEKKAVRGKGHRPPKLCKFNSSWDD